MTAFPKYPAYKDSGLEWLPEVPTHWEVEKARWIFRKLERPVHKDDGIVTCFRDGQVALRSRRREEGFTMAILEQGYQSVRKGELVVHGMDAFAGAIGVSEDDGKCTPEYSVLEPTRPDINNHYFAHLLRVMAARGYIHIICPSVRERAPRFRFPKLQDSRLPIPPHAEQDRIVAFLDEKTAQIAALIAKKQRQIELLDEQKAILINRAVTRGLSSEASAKAGLHPHESTVASAKAEPDLQDSAIPWIGPIPKGWKVKRIGHLGKVGNGSTPSRSNPRYWDRSDFPWLNSGSVNQGVINSSDQSVSRLALRECHLPLLKPKSIVIAITGQGKTRGTAAMLMTPATINQHLAYVEIQSPSALPEFVLLALSAQYQQLRAISETGSTKGALTCQNVKEFKIALPPLDQQKALIEAAESLKAQIATAQSKLESQIQTLQTLRSTLIAHAVTGKIRV